MHPTGDGGRAPAARCIPVAVTFRGWCEDVVRASKRVLFVFPTEWDARQLEHCRESWCDRYEVEWAEPTDSECPWDLDIVDWIDRIAATYGGRIDGITSASDYPGAVVAAVLAEKLGLPGPPPAGILACSHKYYSRLRQLQIVPEATPAFELLDPSDPEAVPQRVGFPCFVKPVKGAFSIMSARIADPDALRRFFARPQVEEFRTNFMHIFNALVRHLTDWEFDGRYFLAEELVQGWQVTVEGCLRGRDVDILGITDSERDPRSGSFTRFVFPSRLDADVCARMEDIARRLVRGLGLADCFFNIEMMVDPERDRIWVIEVNPRICGEFADLYHKVLGVNTFALALETATGAAPGPRPRRGPCAAAASHPLRVFAPVRVERAPGPADLRAAEALFPGTLVWTECEAGQNLADFASIEDGQSCRYAVVNLGAPEREQLAPCFEAVQERLGYRFAPLPR